MPDCLYKNIFIWQTQKPKYSYDFTFKGELLDSLSDVAILSLDVSFLLGLLFEDIVELFDWDEWVELFEGRSDGLDCIGEAFCLGSEALNVFLSLAVFPMHID